VCMLDHEAFVLNSKTSTISYSFMRRHYCINEGFGCVRARTVPGRRDVVDALLADANRFFDDNDINLVTLDCARTRNLVTSLVVERHPNMRLFERNGFLDVRRKARVHYYCCEMDDESRQRLRDIIDTTEAGKVHLPKGDTL